MPSEPTSKAAEEIAVIEVKERHADEADVDRDATQTEAIIRAMGVPKHD